MMDLPRSEDVFDAVDRVVSKQFPGVSACIMKPPDSSGYHMDSDNIELVLLYKYLGNPIETRFSDCGRTFKVHQHDLSSLKRYCTEVESVRGILNVTQIIIAGFELKNNDELLSIARDLCMSIMADGPAKWSDEEYEAAFSVITQSTDIITSPRCSAELDIAAGKLYPVLANCYLRSRKKWSASHDELSDRLNEEYPDFHARFQKAFRAIYLSGETDELLSLCNEALSCQRQVK